VETDLPPHVQITRIIKQLKVIEPEMREDEQLLWEKAANRFQNRLRAVGGRLYLTDRRLVFGRHEYDSRFGGREWAAPLSEIRDVEARGRGPLRKVQVTMRDGTVERFVVRPSDEVAGLLRAAAEAAR
jgi:hypothetical protein